jgi:heme oxygenase
MTAPSTYKYNELLKQNTQIEPSTSTLSALFKSVVYICWYSADIRSDIPSASRYISDRPNGQVFQRIIMQVAQP